MILGKRDKRLVESLKMDLFDQTKELSKLRIAKEQLLRENKLLIIQVEKLKLQTSENTKKINKVTTELKETQTIDFLSFSKKLNLNFKQMSKALNIPYSTFMTYKRDPSRMTSETYKYIKKKLRDLCKLQKEAQKILKG